MREKISKQPPLAPTASTIGPCPTVIQVTRTPRHWKFTQHLRTTRLPSPLPPGRVAQSVGHLTRKSGVRGSIPVWQHIFVSPSAFSRRAVVSYWRKYVHEVLVNRLGGLSLPRKSVVRLTDRPDMTLDVYRGRKTTIQQYNKPPLPLPPLLLKELK